MTAPTPPKASTKANGDPPAKAGGDAAGWNEAFRDAVNMTAAELTHWLKTKESRVVGAKDGKTGTAPTGPESVGHRSGRRIARLPGKDVATLTPGDLAQMRKVVGYVHRHFAHRPDSDVEHSRWRYSLMNWGHDPLRPEAMRIDRRRLTGRPIGAADVAAQ